LIGQEIAPRVTSNVQTSVGRMLFASLDPEVPAAPAAPAAPATPEAPQVPTASEAPEAAPAE
ncbi:MAG: hypothetical protein JOZ04_11425, partial [Acidimicrobiia bacterium]|nr:hypothetical protein [Acidimicrobiia bacterium]